MHHAGGQWFGIGSEAILCFMPPLPPRQPFLYQIERFKQYGPRILHTAACLDYPEIAEALVEQGVPVDSVNHNGESPLLVAIANGHTDMMKVGYCRQRTIRVVGAGGKR